MIRFIFFLYILVNRWWTKRIARIFL